jgi:hypothetical protein
LPTLWLHNGAFFNLLITPPPARPIGGFRTEKGNTNMVYELKTETYYFEEVKAGRKTFEIRKLDRDYKEGDFLMLRKYSKMKKEYSGPFVIVQITFLMHGGIYGLKQGYVGLGIKVCNPEGIIS